MISSRTGPVAAVRPWLAGLLILLGLLGSGTTVACAAETGGSGVIVLVARASKGCISSAIRVAGMLVARTEAMVIPEVEGYRIVQILAREGDKVTANQGLARLTRPAAEGASGSSGASSALVKSPAAGLVIQSNAVVGASASARAGPLFRIAVDGEIELAAEVPSIYLPKLELNQTVRVTTEDNRDLTGHVRTLPAQIDPQTQLGRVRISVEPHPALRVGAFARAAISAGRSCGVSVPKAAVLFRTEGTSVQVVRGDVVETRRVRVGLFSDSAVEIREGVNEGDLVVANAGTSLHDGDKVKPTLPDEAGGR
jgi:multidrug efflux pump subunit AcrA (membrane-fusion protein)